MVKTDITQMSAQEIKEYLQHREEEAAKQLRENVAKWKEELEAHCQKKYGVSLATIFTASSKPRDVKQYKNPETGAVYTYGGRGKLPNWVKPEYEVKSN
jgi:DNA-binding protein H-NS